MTLREAPTAALTSEAERSAGAGRAQPNDGPGGGQDHRCWLAGLPFDPVTEMETVEHIIAALHLGRGGWVATPNVDICRSVSRNPELRELISGASLVVADGMPLLWAAWLSRDPLPERVAGASLIFSLSAAAARQGRSIYLLGGEPGVPERAARELCRRYPSLLIAGTDAPPVGFDASDEGIEAVRSRLVAAAPDIVYVGLGCPKQERLIGRMMPSLPSAWFIGCGAAIPFAAKARRRAPAWMRQMGLSWLFRLATEPRRLFKRYVIHDIPFAGKLLATCAVAQIRRRSGGAAHPPGLS